MIVYAKDGGIPPNFAKAKVHITVLDENDNAPAFGRQHYSLEVPENQEPVELFSLKATDLDTGESGRLNYKITGKTLFLIFLCCTEESVEEELLQWITNQI